MAGPLKRIAVRENLIAGLCSYAPQLNNQNLKCVAHGPFIFNINVLEICFGFVGKKRWILEQQHRGTKKLNIIMTFMTSTVSRGTTLKKTYDTTICDLACFFVLKNILKYYILYNDLM